MDYKESDRAVIYILKKNLEGWQSKADHAHIIEYDKIPKKNVPIGSMLRPVNLQASSQRMLTIELAVLDDFNIHLVSHINDLQEIGREGSQKYQLLRGVRPRDRLRVLNKWKLNDLDNLTLEDHVMYCPGHEDVCIRAVVRFLGKCPQDRFGWQIGLELTSDHKHANTDGYVDGKLLFNKACKGSRGIFCDMSRVRVCQKNCDTNDRAPIYARVNKDTASNNGNTLHLKLKLRDDSVNDDGFLRKFNNMAAQEENRGSGLNGGPHRNRRHSGTNSSSAHLNNAEDAKYRNTSKREKAHSRSSHGSVNGQVRNNLDSQGHSWNPNNGRKKYEKNRYSDRLNRTNSNSEQGRNGIRGSTSPGGYNNSDDRSTSVSPEAASFGPGRHSGGMYSDNGQNEYLGEETSANFDELRARYEQIGDNCVDDVNLKEDQQGSRHPLPKRQISTHKTWSDVLKGTPAGLAQEEVRSAAACQENWVPSEEKDQVAHQQDGHEDYQFIGQRPQTPFSDSPSSNHSLHRVPSVPEFDQLYDSEEHIDCHVIVTGAMVQLELSGQPLFGVVRWRGNMDAAKRDWVGLEMEEGIKGGGSGEYQGRHLFTCPPGKGVFVPITHLRPDPRFQETFPVSGSSPVQDFGSMECPEVAGVCPPHRPVAKVSEVAGRNRGIQGHQNSCYLDATLFSMFTFTSVFDSVLYRPRNTKDVPKYEEVQKVLRDQIVNPLRTKLFVRADRVMTLRTLLSNLSNVSGLTDQEKDPEEFLNSLLAQVLKADPFLELSSGQSTHCYQLFVEKDPNIQVPNIQDLFDQSFLASKIKLKRAPPALILQMPRFGRQFKMYERIIPSQLLDVTDIIEGVPRQCVVCGQIAQIECPDCYGEYEGGLQSTSFCRVCFERTHLHRRTNHSHHNLLVPQQWQKNKPLPRIYMELVAVVCIETSHYVSFVRCGDTSRSPWAFFDSMADRKGEQNGYNIPEVTPAPEVEHILSETGAKKLREDPSLPLSAQAKRFVCDAYMCFYQSPDVKMYH